jgi:hypothetical protein
MIKAAFFIDKIALFGGYPNVYEIEYLRVLGVKWFVDLTHTDEKNISDYSYLVDNWINYPIKDGHVPENKKTFSVFLLVVQTILESLKPGEKMYLHCRGGHGRSSLVAACILSLVTQISTKESLEKIRKCHDLRPELSKKWLGCKSPMSTAQRKYVEGYFGHLWLDSGLSLKMVELGGFGRPGPVVATARRGEVAEFPTFEASLEARGSALDNSESKDHVFTGGDFLKHLCILNYYLHQNWVVLETILNSGLKKLVGEGLVSVMLQTLRGVILQSIAKKLLYE